MTWINAREELPKKHGRYLTLSIDAKTKKFKQEILFFEGVRGEVEYWMPIPKEPEEGERQ